MCIRHRKTLVFQNDSQSRRWPRGVCAGPSGEDPPAESRRRRTSPQAEAADCLGSRCTFHRRPGCRKEAEVGDGEIEIKIYRITIKLDTSHVK